MLSAQIFNEMYSMQKAT